MPDTPKTLRLSPPVRAQAEGSVENLPRGGGEVVHYGKRYVRGLGSDYDPGLHPAIVGVSAGFTSSQNYQSIRLEVRCDVPSGPDADEMALRAREAADFTYAILAGETVRIQALAEALGMGAIPETILVDDGPILDAVRKAHSE